MRGRVDDGVEPLAVVVFDGPSPVLGLPGSVCGALDEGAPVPGLAVCGLPGFGLLPGFGEPPLPPGEPPPSPPEWAPGDDEEAGA